MITDKNRKLLRDDITKTLLASSALSLDVERHEIYNLASKIMRDVEWHAGGTVATGEMKATHALGGIGDIWAWS